MTVQTPDHQCGQPASHPHRRLQYSGNAGAVSGRYAYVADDLAGLRVIDVNPFAPAEVSYFDSDGNGYGVAVSGGYAFLANNLDGSYMLHYSGQCVDPYEPNDDMLQPQPASAGTVYDSLICTGGDQDHYRVTVAGAGAITAELHPPPGLDYDLYLYSGSGALLDFSMQAGDATEAVSYTAGAAADYVLRVRGHTASQFHSSNVYTLIPLFTSAGGGSCTSTPDEALYIYTVTLDINGKPVLHSGSQSGEAVTGYNIYRAAAPAGPWGSPIGSNVVDMDGGTANIQYADLTGDVGGPWYYKANAYNGACGAEGP